MSDPVSPERRSDTLDRFTTAEYETLRDFAHRLKRRWVLAGGAPGTDSLVHEAYLRLKNVDNRSWHDRTHFLAVASLQLRHLLVDHARATHARKRGGGQVLVHLEEESIPAGRSAMDVLVLDEALHRLARHDERQHRVAELRLFGGLLVEEIAAVLGVSERTVKEDWRLARTWLAEQLRADSRGDP
jgi:RNA polymerase sigma factor (TIGR02999 family)